jgi:hypothetical protein
MSSVSSWATQHGDWGAEAPYQHRPKDSSPNSVLGGLNPNSSVAFGHKAPCHTAAEL